MINFSILFLEFTIKLIFDKVHVSLQVEPTVKFAVVIEIFLFLAECSGTPLSFRKTDQHL